MNIGIVLIHNKSDIENTSQISILKGLTQINTEFVDGVDSNGNIIKNAFTQNYFSLIGLSIPHKLYIYHIVPFQPTNTSNPYNAILPDGIYDIYSGGIHYGKGGGEEFIGDHPHFFNWAMDRLFHEHIDIMLYMQDITNFSQESFGQVINPLVDPISSTEYAEDTYGIICTAKLYKQIPKIAEELSIQDSLSNFKDKVIEGGMIDG